jgi:predicted nucleic acid-binding protein
MRAVSNTSPVSNLAIIDRLDLLRARYGTLLIPAAVELELSALSHALAKQRIQSAISDGWIIVKPNPATALPLLLDPGEVAAITLAQSEKADILLIDEKRGRAAARSLSIQVAGVLGELVYAKRIGSISSVKSEIIRLRTDARFFIDPAIEHFILSEVGEA